MIAGARCIGNVTLIDGTATILDAEINAGTLVMLTRKTVGGTIGSDLVYSITPGVSFTITSVGVVGGVTATDTSVVSYLVIG